MLTYMYQRRHFSSSHTAPQVSPIFLDYLLISFISIRVYFGIFAFILGYFAFILVSYNKQIIRINGQKYRKLASIHKIYRETDKAYLIAHKWIPKSQVEHRDGYVYIPEWLYHKKGFG